MSNLNRLPILEIASPCHERWDRMSGSDQTRFCEQCDKHVFNFLEMTDAEVKDVLQNNNSICARIQKRRDGSLVTKTITRRGFFTRVGSVVASIAALLSLPGCSNDDAPIVERFAPGDPTVGDVAIMGEVCPDLPPEPHDEPQIADE